LTVTVVVSLAKPVKEGVVFLDGDFGGFKVTVGAEVLTVKVTVLLFPAAFPSELGCVAIAVYSPLERALLAVPEVQLPPLGFAVALETSEFDAS
jgi:hypothetical protein